MAFTIHSLRHAVYRLILVQSVLVVTCVTYFQLKQGHEFALAALYGGAITLITTLLSAWRITVATHIRNGATRQDAIPGVAEFYKTAIFRLILTIALLAIGLGGLQLDALTLIMGFVAGTLGNFIVPTHPHRA
ncbi:MAG: ATP synthase subunit I [Gammaproteobacteria bacterium]|nr:ATP synthase subunit I [Gammaproteobacteria bacterium]